MRRIAARALKLAIAAALLMLLLVLAQTNAATTAVAIGGLAAAAALWWWWRRPEGAASVVSLAVTMVLTSEMSFWAGAGLQGLSPLRLGYAFWLFAGLVAATTWLTPRHRGSRAVTIGVAHAVLILASVAAAVAPSLAPVAGFAVGMAYVLWRSRRRRWRQTPEAHSSVPFGPAERARGVDRTDEELRQLGDQWTPCGPQQVGRALRLENLVEGPDAAYVVETRQWGGLVDLRDVDGVEVYVLDSDPNALTARLAPVLALVDGVRRERGGDVEGVVVFWDDTRLPGDGVVLDVIAAGRGRTPVRVHLVRGHRLTQQLTGEVRSPGRP